MTAKKTGKADSTSKPRRQASVDSEDNGWSGVDDGSAHFHLRLQILDGRWRRGIRKTIVETELRKAMESATELVKTSLEKVIEAHSPRTEKPKVVPGQP